jgi:DNA helicase-2/ATP-dependent DNA helicase PcrA
MDFDAPITPDYDEPQAPQATRAAAPHAAADPRAFADSLVADLTEPQKQAVLHTEGPLLILAAAGSGKTRVITRRIAYLVNCGVPPYQILAVTFTNKAAGEMKERVAHVLGGPGQDGSESRLMRGLTITTFHSLCARLLRRYAEEAGLKPDFSIYDSSDQLSLVKKAIEAAQLSTANFQPRSVLSAISNAKNDLVDDQQFASEAFDFSTKAIARVYSAYTKRLREANAVDFDDLLMLSARMLALRENVRTECQRRWQYLLIDEYQDTNQAQFKIASLIAGDAVAGGRQPNICVVGDPDQAIYGWRGADISNILDFEKNFPAAAVIKLGENFRSTAPILASADTLIKYNRNRKPKPLFTSKEGGDRIEIVKCSSERHEGSRVAAWLRKQHTDQKIAWREMAVFYRTNALSRVMEEALREANIPYTIAKGTAFYDREEVKNSLAYLRVVANQADSVSLSRIINVPTRGIGDTTYEKVEAIASQHGVPVLRVLRQLDAVPDLSARAINSVNKFVTMLDAWTGGGTFMGAEISGSLADLVDRVIKESGLESMYRAQAATTRNESDAERLDNLSELVSSARQFEQEYDPSADPSLESPSAAGTPAMPPLLAMLRGFLESIALVADADAVDPAQGSVTLMTLHAAKGLEFPAVAMIGLEEGILPHMRARESEAALEEERRLCFVGITRAMRRLLMTASKFRTQRGISDRTIPSRFLDELPSEHVLRSDDAQVDVDSDFDDESQDADWVQTEDSTQRSARQSTPALPVGSTVRHPQFGMGVVKSFTGGAQARVTVAFKAIGTKTLVLEYARLTVVSKPA